MQTTHIPTDEEYQAMLRTVMSRMGQKGGRSKSKAKLDAIAENRKKGDGRKPTTPDGIARKALRNALEGIFGKPLPKEGPVSRIVHKMSSANVVRRVWPTVAENLPPSEIIAIHEKVEELIKILESTGGKSSARNAGQTPADPPKPFDQNA